MECAQRNSRRDVSIATRRVYFSEDSVASKRHRERAARLYRDYGPAVYRRCLRLLGDREAARDATQEVFVRLVRDMGKLDDGRAALPWIYRVATNHCLNVRRDARRRCASSLERTLEVGAARAHEAGEPGYPALHLAQEVLSRFDVKTQAVAVGVFVDEMEHEELAKALGISRRTVRRRLDQFLLSARRFLALDGT